MTTTRTSPLADLVRRTRSVRRFVEREAVSMERLESLAGMARLTASAGNLQPLRYALVTDGAVRRKVFACLGWAAYLPHWKGPGEGERPAAYIVVLANEETGGLPEVDAGIAMQTMLLAAAEQGLAGCILGSVNREKLAGVLDLGPGLRVLYVLALGRPAETVVLEELPPGDVASGHGIEYWRDDEDIHHVPKRPLSDVVVARYGT